MPVQKYHISLRILHWLMALIIIILLAVGFYMSSLDNLDPRKENLYILHKSFGVIIFILVFIRIFFRISKKTPPLPVSMSKLIQTASRLAHYLIYLLMILMPLSGYLMSNYYGFPVIFFNKIQLPSIVGANPELGKIFGEIHEFLAYSLIAILCLHIAAVIKHRFFDVKENDILPRML